MRLPDSSRATAVVLAMALSQACATAVLDSDKAHARARGTFYVRKGGGLGSLKFDNDAEVQLHR